MQKLHGILNSDYSDQPYFPQMFEKLAMPISVQVRRGLR
jgi:hypothetical protein